MNGKRIFDVAVSLVVLVALSPLLLLIAIWIKLDSRGPVLFRQRRVGRWGKEFRILKFRTMRTDSECLGPQITVGDDARITRAGRFLRKHKLDELPQFLNVLVGDMSIVGPRPEVPKYVAFYPEHLRRSVLSVRPGITDLASIRFRRESELLAGSSDPEMCYVHEILPEKLRLYDEYVRTQGFSTDLKIILQTAAILFRGN